MNRRKETELLESARHKKEDQQRHIAELEHELGYQPCSHPDCEHCKNPENVTLSTKPGLGAPRIPTKMMHRY